MASILTEGTGQPRWLHIAPGACRWSPFLPLGRRLLNMKRKRRENCKRRSFNPFTLVRENKFGKKRSRSQRSRKYRKLDMGCLMPSTVASLWQTTTIITTMANLLVPSGPPSTSNIPTMPKLPAPRQPPKMWAKCYPTPVPLSSPVHSDLSWEEDRDGTRQKERERLSKIIREQQQKLAEEGRRKCPIM